MASFKKSVFLLTFLARKAARMRQERRIEAFVYYRTPSGSGSLLLSSSAHFSKSSTFFSL
jgi:hypothetical protein